MIIKQFVYDENANCYTNEIEEVTLEQFIIRYVHRIYDWKRCNVLRKDIISYYEYKGIPYKKRETKIVLLADLIDMSDEKELLEFCNFVGIGVYKYHYLASGMTEQEYKRAYRKLDVIAKEAGNWGYQRKNIYSLEQYFRYVETGSIT